MTTQKSNSAPVNKDSDKVHDAVTSLITANKGLKRADLEHIIIQLNVILDELEKV